MTFSNYVAAKQKFHIVNRVFVIIWFLVASLFTTVSQPDYISKRATIVLSIALTIAIWWNYKCG